MTRILRTAGLRLLPLLAVCAAAQATSIFEFNNPITTTCGGTSGNCTLGVVSGSAFPASGTTSGGADLQIASPEQYLASTTSTTGSGIFSLTWSGIGDGALPGPFPVAWDFTINSVGGTEYFIWDLQVLLGTGGSTYKALDTGNSSILTNSAVVLGGAYASPGSLTTLGAWEVMLTLTFAPQTSGQGLQISQSDGIPAVELGSAVPEPSTWGQAGCGLLFALTLVSRKLRRR